MRFYLLCSVLILVTACQQRTAHSPSNDESLAQSNWHITAKMFINNGEDSGSGRLTWHELNGKVKATFKAPLGQGSWTLDEQNLTMTDDQGQKWHAASMGDLMQSHLGIDLPWSNVKRWLKGEWPEHVRFNENQSAGTFQWQGWQIELKKIKTIDGRLLAHRIHVHKGQQSVKLSIKSWLQ